MPLLFDPHAPQLDTRSELVKAQSRALNGRVNACPFGCDFKHLDDHGYCRHLVGFSHDKRTYEPMIRDPLNGRRVVRCRTKVVEEIQEYDDDGKPVMAGIHVPVLDKLQAGDRLVRITTCYRVYRDVGNTGKGPIKRMEPDQAANQDEISMNAVARLGGEVPVIRSLQTADASEDTIDIQADD